MQDSEGKKHFMETLGNIPEPIRAMAEYQPEVFEGYVRMRKAIYGETQTPNLDLKTKELLYVVLDIVTGNLDGAKNHLQAGMKAGLTVGELSDACMQVMHVCGITTWGKTGWKVVDYAKEIEQGKA
ncbi:alkylhydroperoxidase/carboxymuconolactone decarboxylase family protein YurZ [Rhodoligotrophos appendicifer]|uniref:carboxymuconolactone decarboxylase family protein n=1 Tax=Rhodoligotrophos appendicifer TaxID=987056 RepID=UPI00118536CE|nr:carboxymuconolactone decarboxylase family protein [Rhodoligotrophos appendicifer]